MDSKLGDGVKGVEGAAQLYSGGRGAQRETVEREGPQARTHSSNYSVSENHVAKSCGGRQSSMGCA